MFKAGDIVRPLPGSYEGFTSGSQYNLPRRPMPITRCSEGFIVLDYENGLTSPPVNPWCFELVATCVIRNTIKREIVGGTVRPGNGPRMEIMPQNLGGVEIRFGRHSNTECVFGQKALREAARLFNELADVLEENT